MTDTVRSVTVRMNADVAKYVADMRLAGRETDTAFSSGREQVRGLDSEVGHLEGTLGRTESTTRRTSAATEQLEGRVSGADRAVSRFGGNTQRTGSQIDSLSGRIGLLGEALVVLGPSAIPISAVAVPALVGLTTQIVFAGAAAGVTLLAFQGVKDAITSIEKARLDPTVDNIRAAREELERLGPGAQQLILHLEDLRDEGIRLRDIAGNNLLPGVDQALTSLETRLPQVKRIVREVSDATGDLISRAGESLASDRYDAFFNFLETEARPNIDALGDSVGSLAHGFGSLLIGLQPLERGFGKFLVGATGGIDDFLSSADYEGFIKYVQANGPQVADTFGAIASAIVQIVEAAAPLGGPVLAAVETVADGIGEIADSPLGPKLFTLAAGFVVLNKALALSAGLLGKVGFTGAAAAATAAQGRLSNGFASGGTTATGLSTRVRGLSSDLRSMRSEYTRLNPVQAITTSGLSATTAAAQRTRSTLGALGGGLGKAALTTGAFAVASGVAGKELGLTNTAMLGLVGSMAGPLGGAVGVAVGGFIDVKKTGDTASDAIDNLNQVFRSSSSTIDDYAAAVGQARDVLAQIGKDDSSLTGIQDFVSDGLRGVNEFLSSLDGTSFTDELASVSKQGQQDLTDLARALYDVNDQLGGLPVAAGVSADGLQNTLVNLDAMRQIATSAQPALDDLGLSLNDLIRDPKNVKAVVDQMRFLDSDSGGIQGVAEAVSGLNSQLLSTADSSEILKNALDRLLSPQLNLSEALDQYRSGLRNLDDDLAKSTRSLTAQTDGADANREAIRGQVTNITSLLGAQAEAGASSEQLAGNLQRQRRALLDAGESAGFSRKELNKYLNDLGLTPELVQTVMNANTGKAKSNVDNLQGSIDGLHDKTINIAALTGPARSALASIEAFRIHDKSFTVTQHTNATLGEAKVKKARGGQVYGPGTTTSDSIPALLSNKEYVVNADAVAYYGVGHFNDLNAKRLATGGPAGDDDDSTDVADSTKKLTKTQIAARARKAKARAKANRQADQSIANFDVVLTLDDSGLSASLDSFKDEMGNVRDKFKAAGRELPKAVEKQLKSLKDQSAAYDRLTGTLKTTRDAQAALVGAAAGSVNNDLYGNGLAGLNTQLDADTNDLGGIQAALQRAVANGLDGGLFQSLSASGDANTIGQVGQLDAAGIQALEDKFDNRVNAQQSLGQFAGDTAYGALVRQQTAAADRVADRIDKLEKRLPGAVERGARDGSREGSHEGSKAGTELRDLSKQRTTQQTTQTTSRGGRNKGGKSS